MTFPILIAAVCGVTLGLCWMAVLLLRAAHHVLMAALDSAAENIR